MNTSRFIITFIVVFVVYFLLGWILNDVILNWEGVGGMKDPADMGVGSTILGIIGGLIFAFMFCFIFIKGYEGKGVVEGFRYGLYISLLMFLPLLFVFYGYYTYTSGIIWGFVIGQMIITIILGIVAALLYKPKEAA